MNVFMRIFTKYQWRSLKLWRDDEIEIFDQDIWLIVYSSCINILLGALLYPALIERRKWVVALEEVPVERKKESTLSIQWLCFEWRTTNDFNVWPMESERESIQLEGRREYIPYVESESNGNNEDDNTKEENENECIHNSMMFWFVSTSAIKMIPLQFYSISHLSSYRMRKYSKSSQLIFPSFVFLGVNE